MMICIFVNFCCRKYIHVHCTCSNFVNLVKYGRDECLVPANEKVFV